MQAIYDERTDELIVSTFPGTKSGWLRSRPRRAAAKGHEAARDARRVGARGGGGDRLMEAHAAVDHDARARRAPAGRARLLARRRARARDAALHRLGDHALRVVLHRVLLRAGRQRLPVAAGGQPPAGLRGRREHRHPRHVELHDALGAPVDQARQPGGPSGGPRADVLHGPHVPADADRGVRARGLRARRRRVRDDLLLA